MYFSNGAFSLLKKNYYDLFPVEYVGNYSKQH